LSNVSESICERFKQVVCALRMVLCAIVYFFKKKILRPDFFNGYGKFTALQLKDFGEISLILNSGGVTNK
jgi:hypothetical protein